MSKFKKGDEVVFLYPGGRSLCGVNPKWAKQICEIGHSYKVLNVSPEGDIDLKTDKGSYWCNECQFILKSEYDMQNKSETKLIPFDIERAKKGDKVINGNGDPVRLICFDRDEEKYPLVGITENYDRSVITYSHNGMFDLTDNRTDMDLFMAPVEKTGWVVMVRHKYTKEASILGKMYPNEHDAKLWYDRYASSYSDFEFICTKQITWEE